MLKTTLKCSVLRDPQQKSSLSSSPSLDEHVWEKPPLGRSFSHRGHVLRAQELCPLRIHRQRLQNQNPLIGAWWGPSSPSPLQSLQTWQNTPSAPLALFARRGLQ